MSNLADYIRSIPGFPKPGIIFRDITPLIENPTGLKEAVDGLADAISTWGPIDKIVAPEARGFVFGAPLALRLGAGLVPARKPGKLPYKTVSVEYELEYGTNKLEVHVDSIKPGDRVLLLDDLLATGGTVAACRKLVEGQGGVPVGCAFVIELVDLKGREALAGLPVASLIEFEGE
ncbi:MAG: adenine phosphoribosyltransferase [Thermoguttaceae bacterium]|nr:adenine phosphoribosyltransferase [Thermoguttaceae bacterium]MBQ7109930.1 adenine phosphoribosyltransferase [Thermoguttaceae bacterium]